MLRGRQQQQFFTCKLCGAIVELFDRCDTLNIRLNHLSEDHKLDQRYVSKTALVSLAVSLFVRGNDDDDDEVIA